MLTRERFLSNIGQIVKNIQLRAAVNRRNAVKRGTFVGCAGVAEKRE